MELYLYGQSEVTLSYISAACLTLAIVEANKNQLLALIYCIYHSCVVYYGKRYNSSKFS